jgi:signal transduction histidine kinase
VEALTLLAAPDAVVASAAALGVLGGIAGPVGGTAFVVLFLAHALAAFATGRLLAVRAELLLTERELRAAQADRTVLLDRTLRRGEEERVRVANELHDGAVQRLTALGYLLESAARRTRDGDRAAALASIESARRELSTEIGGLRRLMSDLRPTVLEHHGLEHALRELLPSVLGEADARFVLVSDLGPERLPAETEVVLYRVARESLLNVARHARARSVQVRVARTPSGVMLTVTDDGVGFTPEQARQRSLEGHFGLVGMRERVESNGGRWQLDTAPGRGSRIAAVLPGPAAVPVRTDDVTVLHTFELPAPAPARVGASTGAG